jgi:hypothetical protein
MIVIPADEPGGIGINLKAVEPDATSCFLLSPHHLDVLPMSTRLA